MHLTTAGTAGVCACVRVHVVVCLFPLYLYLASPSLQLGQEQATLRSLLLGAPSWSEELCTEPSWSGLIDEPGPMLLTATVIGDG